MSNVVNGLLLYSAQPGTVTLASLSTAGVTNGQVIYYTGGAWTYATLADVVAGVPTATAAGQIPVSVAAGTSYTATDVDDVLNLAGVYERGYTDAFATNTRWTEVDGNGTATIGSGAATFSTPSGTDSELPNRPSAYALLPQVAVRGCDVAVRVSSMTATLGTNGVGALLILGNLADGANTQYPGATDYGIVAVVYKDGSILVGNVVNGGPFASTFSAGAATITTSAAFWLRVVMTPLGYQVLTGTGATYDTAVWTPRTSTALTVGTTHYTPPSYVAIGGYRITSQAEVATITMSNLVAVVQ